MMTSPPTQANLTRWLCIAATLVGIILTVMRSYTAASYACCDIAYWTLVLKITADFVAVPLLCAWLVKSTSVIGQVGLWAICLYLAAAVYVPFYVPLAIVCLWAQWRWASYVKTLPATSPNHGNDPATTV